MGLLSVLNSDPRPIEAHVALSAGALVAYVIFQAWDMLTGGKFSAEGFAMAVGAILSGGGLVSAGQGYLTRSRVKEREISSAFPGVD